MARVRRQLADLASPAARHPRHWANPVKLASGPAVGHPDPPDLGGRQYEPGPPPSWLTALIDPIAGPALALLHTQPERPWTVDALAAGIGVSRATLARRFAAKVGESPAAYLTRWRMDLAAQRLRDTDDTAGTIARSLGYTSEYAFNRAFTRQRRTPPGRYRAQARSASTSG